MPDSPSSAEGDGHFQLYSATRDFIIYRFDRDSPVVRQRRHAGDAGGEIPEITRAGGLRRSGSEKLQPSAALRY